MVDALSLHAGTTEGIRRAHPAGVRVRFYVGAIRNSTLLWRRRPVLGEAGLTTFDGRCEP